MRARATALIAISISFAGFDAMAQKSWCESIDDQDSFKNMVMAQLAAFVRYADAGAPPEVTLEIERAIYDVPSKQAVATIDDAYDAYNDLCGRGQDEDARVLFQKTAVQIAMLSGYRSDP
jgi:hypothetical protein